MTYRHRDTYLAIYQAPALYEMPVTWYVGGDEILFVPHDNVDFLRKYWKFVRYVVTDLQWSKPKWWQIFTAPKLVYASFVYIGERVPNPYTSKDP